jgi:RNA polymerase sigma-70 factor (ECF subfamily)
MEDKQKEVIEKAAAGDGDAFRELITANKRLVYHIVSRMLPNTSDHEDVCQDVFVKVYRNLNTFNFGSKLSTWIATIAHNTCINFLQKKKVSLIEDCTTGEQPPENLLADFTLPSNHAEKSDLQYRLNRSIAQLPEQ